MTVRQLIEILQALPNQDAIIQYDAGPALISEGSYLMDKDGTRHKGQHLPIDGITHPSGGKARQSIVYLSAD